MVRKRPLVAVALSLYPGLGHVYQRRWLRALLWFGLVASALAFVAPEAALDGSMSILASVDLLFEQLTVAEEFALASIVGFNMLDAYVLAAHAGRQVDDGTPTCPNCGKELDDDLEFCHWCTTRLDRPEESESA